jgi:hypothetical protein
MVAGIDRFTMREIAASVKQREALWQRDLSSPEAYDKSVQPNRTRLRRILGVLEEDKRAPMPGLELVTTTERGSNLADTQSYVIHVVRWPVLDGVNGEGLLFRQRADAREAAPAAPRPASGSRGRRAGRRCERPGR